MRTGRVPARLIAAAVAITGLSACAGDDAAVPSDATTTATVSSTAAPAPPAPPAVDVCPFAGLGTWVDVYDHVTAFIEAGRAAPVSADDVAAMRAAGVDTLYLQVAKDDPRSPGLVTDETQAAAFLQRAHAAGMRVIAWYLPTHRDHELDVARMEALVGFETDGHRFDGIALDIEGTDAVADIVERNRLLLDLVARTDAAAGPMPVGAIVYPPVVFDDLNPTLWPDFPWVDLATHVDVWLPMAYWTFRDSDSRYRDAYVYSTENVDRVREHIGDPDAPVHVIGGIGDRATAADLEGFGRAARDTRSIGWSMYDYATTTAAAWPILAAAPVACELCCSADVGSPVTSSSSS